MTERTEELLVVAVASFLGIVGFFIQLITVISFAQAGWWLGSVMEGVIGWPV